MLRLQCLLPAPGGKEVLLGSWLPSALQEAGLGVTDSEVGGDFPAVAE